MSIVGDLTDQERWLVGIAHDRYLTQVHTELVTALTSTLGLPEGNLDAAIDGLAAVPDAPLPGDPQRLAWICGRLKSVDEILARPTCRDLPPLSAAEALRWILLPPCLPGDSAERSVQGAIAARNAWARLVPPRVGGGTVPGAWVYWAAGIDMAEYINDRPSLAQARTLAVLRCPCYPVALLDLPPEAAAAEAVTT